MGCVWAARGWLLMHLSWQAAWCVRGALTWSVCTVAVATTTNWFTLHVCIVCVVWCERGWMWWVCVGSGGGMFATGPGLAYNDVACGAGVFRERALQAYQ
jgi:hypothetical protein